MLLVDENKTKRIQKTNRQKLEDQHVQSKTIPKLCGPIKVHYIPTYLPVVLGSKSGRKLSFYIHHSQNTVRPILPYISKQIFRGIPWG
jgi:hypothetical protein